jgi:type II secretory pathway pseudopilin PulG
VELAMAMVVFGIVSAIAVGGIRSLRDANAEQSAHREVISAMRGAQQRALSEATTFCVDFGSAATATQFSVYRVPGAGSGVLSPTFACTTGTKVDGPVRMPTQTRLTDMVFSQRNGVDTQFVLFYPRGAASPGSLTVRRTGSSKTYRLVVDALTGRVADPDVS